MNAGILLMLEADLIDLFEKEGIIDTAGNFANVSPDKYADLGSKLVTLLTTYGVVLPPKVLKIIQLLPLILQIAEA